MDVNTVMMKMARMLSATQENECDCNAVYEVMDEIVEAMESGLDLTESMPEIYRHLEMCPCCHLEVEALKKILQASEVA